MNHLRIGKISSLDLPELTPAKNLIPQTSPDVPGGGHP